MSTAMTLFSNPEAQVPAHVAAAFEGKDNVLPRDTTPALTFRGKTWRLRQGGEETILTTTTQDGEKMPAPVVKIIVLDMNQKRSRMFYARGYEEGKNQSPTCWSSDGERPDADVPATQKCAATCGSCPNSVKGSKITDNGKETTACSPMKRLAVIPSLRIGAIEPLLLKVPQTSLWDKTNEEANAQGYFAWDQYVDFLRQRAVNHTAAVVTKVKFDPTVAYPKLLFTAERWLEADEVAKVAPMVKSDAVQKLLSGKIHEGGDEPPAEPAPAASPAPAAAPAARRAPAAAAAPTAPPLAAKAPQAAADDGGDAFASVGQAAPAPAATAAPKPARAPAGPKAPPATPVPPKPPVAAPTGTSTDELQKLAEAWDA